VARCFKIVHHSEVHITSSVTISCFLKGYRKKIYSYDKSKEPQTSMRSWNRLYTRHKEGGGGGDDEVFGVVDVI